MNEDGPSNTAVRPVVICPLQFERSVLLRHGVGKIADVVCFGPGPSGVRRAAANIQRGIGSTVLLIGVAGALGTDHPPGTAWWIDRVTNPAGEESWTPTLAPAQNSGGCASVLGVESIIAGDGERAALKARCGADLVDMESVAFAQEGIRRCWNWGIVRGVSDAPGPGCALPLSSATWVNRDGATRLWPVLRWVMLHPTGIARLRTIRRHAVTSLETAAEMIHRGVSVAQQ